MGSKIGRYAIIFVIVLFIAPILYSIFFGQEAEMQKSALSSASSKSSLSGAELYTKCASCHGANGDGSEGFPVLNVLTKEQLLSRFTGYQNDTYGSVNNRAIMRVQLEGMSDEDLQKLASYISTLKPNKEIKNKDNNFEQKKREIQYDNTGISS